MIKKSSTLIFTSVVLLLLCLCQQKKSSKLKTVTPAPQPTPSVEDKEFIPPVDSTISAAQMKSWMQCNPLLDSLTFKYADSFKTTDATLRLRYQEDFSKAQNKLCVLAGLPGGYREYTWIMKTSGNPKNKAVLDSAGAQVK